MRAVCDRKEILGCLVHIVGRRHRLDSHRSLSYSDLRCMDGGVSGREELEERSDVQASGVRSPALASMSLKCIGSGE